MNLNGTHHQPHEKSFGLTFGNGHKNWLMDKFNQLTHCLITYTHICIRAGQLSIVSKTKELNKQRT